MTRASRSFEGELTIAGIVWDAKLNWLCLFKFRAVYCRDSASVSASFLVS